MSVIRTFFQPADPVLSTIRAPNHCARTAPFKNEGGSHSPGLRGFYRQFLIRWQYILVTMKKCLRGEGGVIVCVMIYVVVSTHVICDRFQRV